MYSIKMKATQVIISARFCRYWVSSQTKGEGRSGNFFWIGWKRHIHKCTPSQTVGCWDCIAMSFMIDQCIGGGAVSSCSLSEEIGLSRLYWYELHDWPVHLWWCPFHLQSVSGSQAVQGHATSHPHHPVLCPRMEGQWPLHFHLTPPPLLLPPHFSSPPH